jgi:hypothetical protein
MEQEEHLNCSNHRMDVTAEAAEAAEDSPTVLVPLLLQSFASSASSAVHFCCS